MAWLASCGKRNERKGLCIQNAIPFAIVIWVNLENCVYSKLVSLVVARKNVCCNGTMFVCSIRLIIYNIRTNKDNSLQGGYAQEHVI